MVGCWYLLLKYFYWTIWICTYIDVSFTFCWFCKTNIRSQKLLQQQSLTNVHITKQTKDFGPHTRTRENSKHEKKNRTFIQVWIAWIIFQLVSTEDVVSYCIITSQQSTHPFYTGLDMFRRRVVRDKYTKGLQGVSLHFNSGVAYIKGYEIMSTF